MELKTLQRITVDALEDVKAQDIQVYDTLGQSSEFDRVIIASGNSNRQTRALAWSVVQKVKQAGGHVTGVEGTDTGEWVLVDLGDIVVHIMVPPVRAYYSLEEIWGSKPVRAKAPVKKPPKKSASRPIAPKVAAKKTTKKAAAKSAAKAKPSAKRASPRKTAAKGKRAAPVKKKTARAGKT